VSQAIANAITAGSSKVGFRFQLSPETVSAQACF